MNIRIEWGRDVDTILYMTEEYYYAYFMVAIDMDTKEELGRFYYDWRLDGIEGPGTPSREELESYAAWLQKKYPVSTVTTW